ncbi:alpha-amylase family protein [Natrinema sp. 74]|uniref:alpha-amylase family protein n=1 Tax=Natrinema sp. 74 TaxID=3384159 RepID=UPI0038D44A4A
MSPERVDADDGSETSDALTELRNQTGEQWYENGLVYAIDVKTFADSDGDGVGDFEGLTNRLEYLDRLGVTCLWLLPFYPSPDRDNGYDVADYYAIDGRLGTLGDFVRFVRQAHQRGIKVVVDLVVNHTSSEHPWFQRAREDPDSRYRDYYVWADDPPEPEKAPIFPSEDSVWSYDDEAGAYYYHRFYDFEPGLDHSNPDVRDEIRTIMDFWLQLGIDGFRIDATPILIQRKGLDSTELDEPHRILKAYRAFVSRRNEDAILLGETGGTPEEVAPYFGDGTGDEMHLLFDFMLTDYLFAALAAERAEPLTDGLRSIPVPPENGQWANFLRNLDELNLEWLSADECQTVLDRFAPDEEMRIYGRGSRRRLAPMLGDRRLLELAASLLFSMPGTPVIPYGDEIGMGDDLSLEGRTAVRTPMQWADEESAGFSSAPPEELIRPVVSEGEFGYERVNVDEQRADPDSLLWWMRRAISVRQEHAAFGRGTIALLETEPDSVVCHRMASDRYRDVIAVHNLTDDPRQVTLDVDADLVEIFGDGRTELTGGDSVAIELAGYGYCWYRVDRTPP